MRKYKYPIVLSIAGSDSGGGAGIQADLKTISAIGCYGTTAITSITVQNTLGVSGIYSVPVEIVVGQIKAVMDDFCPSAIKIGMIYSAGLPAAIAGVLNDYKNIPIVFDPVMKATTGQNLTDDESIEAFKKYLFPLVNIITPNLDEASILTGMEVSSLNQMRESAARITASGCDAVLVKGGHLKGPALFDVYRDKNGKEEVFNSTAIDTVNTHGTGCSLSSAIASFLALGYDLSDAIAQGRMYVHKAIESGKDVKTGKGAGPLNHFFDPQKMIKLANLFLLSFANLF